MRRKLTDGQHGGAPASAAEGAEDAREAGRLAALRRYAVLDTPDEEAFDRIARLACDVLGTPVAEVSLVDRDRQWAKARVPPGGPREVPRAWSFCTHAVREAGVMVVPDAREDARFRDNPFVAGAPYVRFYAGAPLRTPDGHVLGTLCVVSPEPRAGLGPEEQGKLQALADIVVDELELRRRQHGDAAMLNNLLENSSDCIKVLSLDGELESMNTGGMAVMEVDDFRACHGQAWPGFWNDEMRGKVLDAVAEARAGRTGRFEGPALTMKGTPKWWDVTVSPILGEDGRPERLLAVSRDVTARRRAEEALRELAGTLERRVEDAVAERGRAEEALRQAQKMEAVGQLTGGIAHDFNNLLTAIAGSLELLDARVRQGRVGELDRFVAAAQGAARRAAALTHRLLAFSRRQTLDPKPTDVNRLVAGMEELVRRTMGPAILVEVVAAGGLWATLIDAGQLENALLNLCINARDAMPDGGRLTVETANKWLDDRAARERDLVPGQYVSLCVSDTGTGMPPEVVARAFDPFFTTKPTGMGTGLGLSMVYGFARQSGGQARIYSEAEPGPAQGTMVCLYLPRHYGGGAEADTASSQAEAPPRAEQGETVLVVDDEPAVRMLVAEVLEELGYSALEAGDGPAGLRLLQSDARIDLLITDVGLPGGLNGRQLADAARQHRPELKVLFITGYAENAAVGNGRLEPGMHVLTKPFAMDALAARVRAIVEGG